MANFVKHDRCPECTKRGNDRQGNNLGVYDDGSCYCFNCGYYIHVDSFSKFNNMGGQGRVSMVQKETPSISLPPDCDTYIPAVARVWLGKYDITEYEIINNKLLWSEYWQQLIFPYFDKYMNLCAWQGRSFEAEGINKHGNVRGRSKWFSQGNLKNLYHILPIKETYEQVVLVEDIVSAIKVSRITPAMPIFGSQIGLERFKTLSERIKEVVIWLDPNMKKQMVTEARKAELMGLRSRVIFSANDPKEHTMEEIYEYLVNK